MDVAYNYLPVVFGECLAAAVVTSKFSNSVESVIVR